MKIEVFTDGSATTKGSPGGWASVILVNDVKVKELAGHLESATNNDAELIAALMGLEYAVECSIGAGDFDFDMDVTLCSDSKLVLGWASGEYRFKQEDKMDLYHSLTRLVRKLRVKTQWIEGHSGNEHNERCDKLANLARKKLTEEFKAPPLKDMSDSKIGTKKNHVVSVWYGDVLKIVDFEHGIIENYSRDVHGKRGSVIQIRDCKNR